MFVDEIDCVAAPFLTQLSSRVPSLFQRSACRTKVGSSTSFLGWVSQPYEETEDGCHALIVNFLFGVWIHHDKSDTYRGGDGTAILPWFSFVTFFRLLKQCCLLPCRQIRTSGHG